MIAPRDTYTVPRTGPKTMPPSTVSGIRGNEAQLGDGIAQHEHHRAEAAELVEPALEPRDVLHAHRLAEPEGPGERPTRDENQERQDEPAPPPALGSRRPERRRGGWQASRPAECKPGAEQAL